MHTDRKVFKMNTSPDGCLVIAKSDETAQALVEFFVRQFSITGALKMKSQLSDSALNLFNMDELTSGSKFRMSEKQIALFVIATNGAYPWYVSKY